MRAHTPGPAACSVVSQVLASVLADDAVMFFSVTLKNGHAQLYATRVTKERARDATVVLHVGMPTTPKPAGITTSGPRSPYPVGRGAECMELALGSGGCRLEYLQTRAKYFLPAHFDDPLTNVPLKRCTQPYMREGDAPWGKVWLEVTRQLCLRLGLHALDLQDESSITLPSGQLVSLARLKLLTEGSTWYERVLAAAPLLPRVAAAYTRGKARLRTATLADVTDDVLRKALAAAARGDGGPLPRPSDAIAGGSGVVARVLDAAARNLPAVMRALAPLGLTNPANCEHGSVHTAVSTALGLLLSALNVLDPYAVMWRADLIKTRPLVSGVTVHGYLPAGSADVATLLSA